MLILFWSKQKNKFNYGDELSHFIVSKIAKQKPLSIWPYTNNSKSILRKCVSFLRLLLINGINHTFLHVSRSRRAHVVGLGSIINRANHLSSVWGSGIISAEDKINPDIQVFVVRGPLTLKLINEIGIKNRGAMGDPALLLPCLIPKLQKKTFEFGIIPHVKDYEYVVNNFKAVEGWVIIDLSNRDLEALTERICSCEKIVSSSLHGIIVANAYNIPTVRAEFTNKLSGDGIKFMDYMYSVGATAQEAQKCYKVSNQADLVELINENEFFCPDQGILEDRKRDLLNNAPFELKKEYV